MTIETHLAGRLFPGDRADLISYLESVGYTHLSWGHAATNTGRQELGTTDDLFVKSGVELFQIDGRDEL